MKKYSTTCPGAHSTVTTSKFNPNRLASEAHPRLASGDIPSVARPAARHRKKRSATAEALRLVGPPVEPGWALWEERQARLPESIWVQHDRDRNKPVPASPAPKVGTCEPPPTQRVKDTPPSKARPVVHGNQPANSAVLEKGEIEPLLINAKETCRLLGGICKRSLARMEKAGLIRSLHLLRHKLYVRQEIESFVEGLRNWRA